MTVAVVFLILILTAVGIIMLYTKNNNQIYPPTSSKCPDYWTLGADGVTCTSRGINNGSVTATGPVLSVGGNSFQLNLSDSSFTERGMTKTCGQKRWATTNKIEWDGVSNYNKC